MTRLRAYKKMCERFLTVPSASLYDIIFRRCYHIRRQQQYKMETMYEKPLEIEFTGQACPWA